MGERVTKGGRRGLMRWEIIQEKTIAKQLTSEGNKHEVNEAPH